MTRLNPTRWYFVWLLAASLPAAGCGKTAPPPPGAPQDATAPAIDLGTPSDAGDTGAGSTNSAADGGSPQTEQGEKK